MLKMELHICDSCE